MLSIVVAKAKNNMIGRGNKLIWKLPADLQHFKELTTGHVIIMGRKTFESLGRVLPNRKHIVFSQNPDFKVNDENVQVVHSMLEIQEYIENNGIEMKFETTVADLIIENNEIPQYCADSSITFPTSLSLIRAFISSLYPLIE